MRARHRHSGKLRGEAHRARGGGVSHHPSNAIEGEGCAPKLHAGKRARGGKVKKRADGGGTDTSTQPLRDPGGQFISPQGPLAATGPATFRNSMRAIGVQPTEYNKKAKGGRVKHLDTGGSATNPKGDTTGDDSPLTREQIKTLMEQMGPPSGMVRKKGGGIHIKKSHRGLLHKDLHVAQGEPIPAGKLAKAEHSSNTKVRKRAVFAENAKHWHH